MAERQQSPRRGNMRGRMGGGPPQPGTGEKARDLAGSFAKLTKYIGKHLPTVIVVFILAAVSTVFTIVGPKILGKATDELITGVMGQITGAGSVDFPKIESILLWLGGLYVLAALLSYLQGFLMSGVTNSVTKRLRRDIERKANRLPLRYFDGTTHGEVLSHMTNDVDAINQSLNQSITQMITSLTSVVGVLIMMFTISPLLTLVALLTVPLTMVVMGGIMKKSQPQFKDQQKYLGTVNGWVEENYSSHVVVKAFCAEEESERKFEKENQKLYKSGWKSGFLSGLMMPITQFIGNLGYVGVVILGSWIAAHGGITLGNIQSFIQYMRSFSMPLAQIANITNMLQQTAAAAERVFDFLEQEEEPADAPGALQVRDVNPAGAVTFQNVHFGYDPAVPILKDFSADIKPGTRVAIVGPTGAGKTTIVKLLMRFYDIQSGSILLDGHNICDWERNELRSVFGMVLQDTWLTSGTIEDNIRYGKRDAAHEDVVSAARAAHIDHFIHTLPHGYHTELGEDTDTISQGQKQLLTIARAILADPTVLILDEATSSVDTRTEVQIQRAMENLMQNRTSFIIAHRLSTIRNADLILVLKDGDIIEQGTHENLLVADGFYANLYRSQFAHAA